MASEPSLSDLEARIARLEAVFGPKGDPPPDDLARLWFRWRQQSFIPGTIVGPIVGPEPSPVDPLPPDLSRLSKVQLELVVEQIKAERIRLDTLEQHIQRQITELG